MMHFSMAASVEKIYEAAFAVEDALAIETETSTEYDRELLHERRKEAIAVLKHELFLEIPFEQLSNE